MGDTTSSKSIGKKTSELSESNNDSDMEASEAEENEEPPVKKILISKE